MVPYSLATLWAKPSALLARQNQHFSQERKKVTDVITSQAHNLGGHTYHPCIRFSFAGATKRTVGAGTIWPQCRGHSRSRHHLRQHAPELLRQPIEWPERKPDSSECYGDLLVLGR